MDKSATTIKEMGQKFFEHPTVRIVAYLLGCFCIYLVVGFPLAFVTILHPVVRKYPWLVNSFLEATCTVMALVATLQIAENRRPSNAGFTFRGVFTETTAGAMIGIAAISSTIGIMAVCGFYHEMGVTPHFHVWLPLMTYLLAAIAEETVFRGMVLRVLEYRYGSFVALAASSLVFGLAHLANPAPHESVWFYLAGPVFIAFEGGILLGAAYIATRRIWLPIGIHWAWNYFEGPVYGTGVSGNDIGGAPFLKSTLHGPFLLTGGAFGPEASIICVIVCTIAGLMMVRVAVRAGQWKPAGERQPASLAR